MGGASSLTNIPISSSFHLFNMTQCSIFLVVLVVDLIDVNASANWLGPSVRNMPSISDS